MLHFASWCSIIFCLFHGTLSSLSLPSAGETDISLGVTNLRLEEALVFLTLLYLQAASEKVVSCRVKIKNIVAF